MTIWDKNVKWKLKKDVMKARCLNHSIYFIYSICHCIADDSKPAQVSWINLRIGSRFTNKPHIGYVYVLSID